MKRFPVVIVMAFASLAVISPVLGTKVISLGGITFTAGIFTMLLAYSLLNVVNELWGRADAQFLAAAIVLIRIVLFVGLIPLIIKWPAYLEPEGYSQVLRLSLRTFLASETSALVQNVLIDIPIFHALKKIRYGFLFRANASNIISWSFGTVCFVFISYWGAPKSLLPIILGQTLIKFPLSFVYSWVGWRVVRWARNGRLRPKPRGEDAVRVASSADA
jgi:uncharacterized integral membrane protein (TIGR00697 family)